MPTGLTAPILEGCSFKDFAVQCAFQFGALIDYRDVSSRNRPLLPVKIEPDTYHKEQYLEAVEELSKIQAWAEQDIQSQHAAYLKRFSDQQKKTEAKAKDEATLRLAAYQRMLAKAEQFRPPTSEHRGFKDLMIAQIKQSMEWDCRDAEKEKRWEKEQADYVDHVTSKAPKEWYAEKVAELAAKRDRHLAGWQLDVRRAEEKSLWIQQLCRAIDEVQ